MNKRSRRKFLIGGSASLCLATLNSCNGANQEDLERRGSAELMHFSTVPPGVSLHPVERLVMVRDSNGIGAFSLLCTHQTCLLTQENSGGGFFCPCHGSQFDKIGRVIAGPAAKDLPWYELSLLPNGVLQINFAKHVSSNWRLQIG